MGILSRIFGKPKKEQTSYVRAWAEKKEKESRYAKELNPEILFGAFVYGISEFGQCWQSFEEPDDVPQDKKQYADEPYSGDSSIFEIGCYFYTNIDAWLFGNKPERREQLSGYLCQQFIDLFSEVLPIGNVEELFNERVTKYGELLRNNADIETIHLYLNELVRRTKYNTLPKRANFEDFKQSSGGCLFDYVLLKTHIMGFETYLVPGMIESVENYIQMLGI